MKKIFLPAICLGILTITSFNAAAQSKTKDKQKDKLGEYDNLIIKWKGEKGEKGEKGQKGEKGNKDVKITIEIKNDDIIVNGKPLGEYNDKDLAILKRNSLLVDGHGMQLSSTRSPRSMFQGYSIDLNSDRGSERSTRPFLGVGSEKTDGGVVITEITDDSGAEKAGLKKGDIITKLDDVVITSPDVLTKTIGSHKPNDKITITYKRNNKEEKVTATLGRRSEGNVYNYQYNGPGFKDFNFDWGNGQQKIGIRAQDTDDGKGVKVLEIDDESAAEKAGLKEDDIIISLDNRAVNSVTELVEISKTAREAKKISMPLQYLRDGKQIDAELRIPRKLKTAEL